LRRAGRYLAAVLIVAAVVTAVFAFFPGVREREYLNEYGEGIYVVTSISTGSRGYDWKHGETRVSTVTVTYSVTITGMVNIDHYNVTLQGGYLVRFASNVYKLGEKTWTFQTEPKTFTLTVQESLDTHIGRFESNPQHGEIFYVDYYVRFRISYLGAKSGNVYVVTDDGDSVLENEDWEFKVGDTVKYTAISRGIHNIFCSHDAFHDSEFDALDILTDGDDLTDVGVGPDEECVIRVFFWVPENEKTRVIVKVRGVATASSFGFVRLESPDLSKWGRLGNGGEHLPTSWGWVNLGNVTKYLLVDSYGFYVFDIYLGYDYSTGGARVSEIRLYVVDEQTGEEPLEVASPRLQLASGCEDWSYPYSWYTMDISGAIVPLVLVLAVLTAVIVRRRR